MLLSTSAFSASERNEVQGKRKNGKNKRPRPRLWTMEELVKKTGKALQGEIPVEKRPFRMIAEEIGTTEEDVINAIRKMRGDGTIRKFGAILRHRKAGYTVNAMVLWSVKAEDVEEKGKAFSALREVTHCYERTPAFDGRYNIFTMVHAREGEEILEVVKRLSATAGVGAFEVLESIEEFKKSSMEYF